MIGTRSIYFKINDAIIQLNKNLGICDVYNVDPEVRTMILNRFQGQPVSPDIEDALIYILNGEEL